MTIKEIQKKVLPLLQSYDIHRAGLFGSSAREQMSAESDVDILIDLKNDVGLVEFVGLKQKLEEELGRPVDLVEYGMLKPALREKILQSEVALL